MSPKSDVHQGPAAWWLKSRTRTPASAPVVRSEVDAMTSGGVTAVAHPGQLGGDSGLAARGHAWFMSDR